MKCEFWNMKKRDWSRGLKLGMEQDQLMDDIGLRITRHEPPQGKRPTQVQPYCRYQVTQLCIELSSTAGDSPRRPSSSGFSRHGIEWQGSGSVRPSARNLAVPGGLASASIA